MCLCWNKTTIVAGGRRGGWPVVVKCDHVKTRRQDSFDHPHSRLAQVPALYRDFTNHCLSRGRRRKTCQRSPSVCWSPDRVSFSSALAPDDAIKFLPTAATFKRPSRDQCNYLRWWCGHCRGCKSYCQHSRATGPHHSLDDVSPCFDDLDNKFTSVARCWEKWHCFRANNRLAPALTASRCNGLPINLILCGQ